MKMFIKCGLFNGIENFYGLFNAEIRFVCKCL